MGERVRGCSEHLSMYVQPNDNHQMLRAHIRRKQDWQGTKTENKCKKILLYFSRK